MQLCRHQNPECMNVHLHLYLHDGIFQRCFKLPSEIKKQIQICTNDFSQISLYPYAFTLLAQPGTRVVFGFAYGGK